MRLGVDAAISLVTPRTGLFNHFRHVVLELGPLIGSRPQCFIPVRRDRTIAESDLATIKKELPSCDFRVITPPARFFRIWMKLARFNRVDVLWHNLGSQIPVGSCPANVYLIPDLIPLVIDYGDSYLRKACLEYCESATKSADAVIVSSEHTKCEFLQLTQFPEDRVCVVPLGVSKDFSPQNIASAKRVTKELGLSDAPYFLYVSSVEKRKNHSILLRAFASLIAKDTTIRHRLVFAGSKWKDGDKILSEADKLMLGDRFRYLGYASDLPALYAGAFAFVFPSLYEGFGLPILEAMASGIPVLGSSTTSIPEVVGDAGLLFDPADELDLVRRLSDIVYDEGTRQRLIKLGLQRASEFTWRRTAEGYLSAFEIGLENKRRGRK